MGTELGNENVNIISGTPKTTDSTLIMLGLDYFYMSPLLMSTSKGAKGVFPYSIFFSRLSHMFTKFN